MLDLKVKPPHDAPLRIALVRLPLAVDSLPSIHSYARNWPAAPSTPSRQGIDRQSASDPLAPKSLTLTDYHTMSSRSTGVSRKETAILTVPVHTIFSRGLRVD